VEFLASFQKWPLMEDLRGEYLYCAEDHRHPGARTGAP